MNKKKIIIITSAVAIAGITATSMLALSVMDGWNSPTGVIPGEPEAENVVQMAEPEYVGDVPYEIVESIVGQENGLLIQEGQAKAIASEARRLMSTYKFEEAEAYILDSVKEYDALNSPYYLEFVEPIRMDIPALSQLDYLYEYGDVETMKSLISNLSDPTNILIANLWMEPQIRETVIISHDSLNPTFEEITEISSMRKEKKKIGEFPEVEDTYVIDFKLDGYSLTANIIDVYGWLYLHSIESEDENHPYITIKEWNRLRDEVNGLIDPDIEIEQGELLEISEGETQLEEGVNETGTEN